MQPRMDESWLEAVGDELETARNAGSARLPRRRGRRRTRLLPARPTRLQRAAADPARRRAGRDPRAGSLPRPRPGDGPLLLRSARRAAAPVTAQHLHGAGTDLGLPGPTTGDLTPWAERGVLLLNSVLTVSPGSPASHAGQGLGARSPTASSPSCRRVARASSSSSGAATRSRRARSSTRRATTCSPPRTPPRTRRRAGSSAAATSRAPTRCSTADGRPPVDWSLS